MKNIFKTCLLFVLILAIGSLAALAETYYVYTENGKTLNLRSATDNKVIANIPYGTELEPDEELSTESAAYVTYKGESGYVKWKYLVKEKPASRKKTAVTPEPTAMPQQYAQSQTMQTGNIVAGASAYSALFSGFQMNRRQTTLIQAAPMRWVPDETAPIMRNYQSGQAFEVLVENVAWCQVLDSVSGLCGFIQKSLLN